MMKEGETIFRLESPERQGNLGLLSASMRPDMLSEQRSAQGSVQGDGLGVGGGRIQFASRFFSSSARRSASSGDQLSTSRCGTRAPALPSFRPGWMSASACSSDDAQKVAALACKSSAPVASNRRAAAKSPALFLHQPEVFDHWPIVRARGGLARQFQIFRRLVRRVLGREIVIHPASRSCLRRRVSNRFATRTRRAGKAGRPPPPSSRKARASPCRRSPQE